MKIDELNADNSTKIYLDEINTNYKKYRNLLSALMKKSKQAYYDKYLERNWNIKNTWKGIKSLVSLKTSIQCTNCTVPTDTITNPYDIANNLIITLPL